MRGASIDMAASMSVTASITASSMYPDCPERERFDFIQRISMPAGLFGSQLNRLPVIVQDVFNNYAGVVDLNQFVFSFNNVTLPGDEHFTLIVKKDLFGFIGFACESIKLEWN